MKVATNMPITRQNRACGTLLAALGLSVSGRGLDDGYVLLTHGRRCI